MAARGCWSQHSSIVLPLFVLVIAVAIVGTLVQTGPVFSTHPLKPDFDRLNPVSGFKRLFSLRLLFELGKNLVKLVLLGGAMALLLRQLVPELLALLLTEPAAYLRLSHGWVSGLIFKLAMVLAFIALIDVMFTRWSFADKMKMSRREVKEEIKQREGDPHVRARIRELQRETGQARQGDQAAARCGRADHQPDAPRRRACVPAREDGGAAGDRQGRGRVRGAHARAGAPPRRAGRSRTRSLARALFTSGRASTRKCPSGVYPQVARVLVRAYALRAAKERRA